MNFFKRYIRQVIIRLKIRVKAYVEKKVGYKGNGEINLALYEKHAQKNKYDQFLLKFGLRKFQSASDIALTLNYRSLSLREKLVVIKCLYSSVHGVLADQLLEQLCDTVFGDGQLSTKLVVAFLERVSISGFDTNKKLSMLAGAKAVLDDGNDDHIRELYSISWMEYSLTNDMSGAVDPKKFVRDSDVAECDISLLARFLPSLNSFGHRDLVRSTLARHYENHGISSASDLRLYSLLLPDYVRNTKDINFVVPLTHDSISILPILNSGRNLNPVIEEKYTELFEYLRGEFKHLGLLKQDAFLRFLLKQERYDEILDLAPLVASSEELSPIHLAQGFTSLSNDDYFTARDCFQRVLLQDPSDSLAATGLRFALPRVGRTMREMLNLRDKAGYGTKSSGRTGVRDIGGELTISLLMSGDYIKGQYSKRQSKHWLAMKARYGERFLNFERLQETNNKTIFIIGDEGVGDEIRTSQFYNEIAKLYQHVIVSCDPRLVNIFEASFPEFTFIPVPRIRKILGNSAALESQRLQGFGEKISNYLTEDCRSYMNSADVITFGQNIFFNYVLGEISRPEIGPYLKLPRKKENFQPSEKLRVGILWRSHLREGARKMMYLAVEDFAPLLDFEELEVWSVQHSIDEQELDYCSRNAIRVIDDVDLFNDFEGMANYLSELDLLVGVSSVPMELGAALGVETWMLGFSPENYYLRTAGGKVSEDQYTMNSSVIAPPWIDFSNPRSECVKQVLEEVVRRLQLKVGAAGLEACANEKF